MQQNIIKHYREMLKNIALTTIGTKPHVRISFFLGSRELKHHKTHNNEIIKETYMFHKHGEFVILIIPDMIT